MIELRWVTFARHVDPNNSSVFVKSPELQYRIKSQYFGANPAPQWYPVPLGPEIPASEWFKA